MVDRKRPPIVIWLLPLMAGMAGFNRVTQSPSFEFYRTVDVVQLLGSGVCFGAVMVGVIVPLIQKWRFGARSAGDSQATRT